MANHRLYISKSLQNQSNVTLTGDEHHYIAQVLRCKLGTPITLFDGEGGEYLAEISHVDRHTTQLFINAFNATECESPLHIHLGQVIAKGERMDFIVQKAVELGVGAITPLFAERCNVKLDEPRLKKRQAHWQKIAVQACQQCGRNRVPIIHNAVTLSDWLANTQGELKLILNPYTSQPCAHPKKLASLDLLIGPEGGLAPAEVDLAQQHQFQSLQLGPRILRTETAALAAVSFCQLRWGDFAAPHYL